MGFLEWLYLALLAMHKHLHRIVQLQVEVQACAPL